jgi:light-regulated signal transduction histidine kinase (bacteriophytochrome)
MSALDDLASVKMRFREFAYVVGHDLHAPLRAIVNLTKLLEEEQVTADERKEYLNIITRAGQQMQAKLDGLLSYSRLNTMALAPTDHVDAREIIENCLTLMNRTIKEKKAEIKLDALPFIEGDTDQLIQLFTFLLDNALKFSRPDQPPRIRIQCQDLKGCWQFMITDNGIGIEPRYREEVFKLFRQLNSPEDYSGIGVGLTFCQKIVEQHGGKIWIEDGDQGGVRLCFTLKKNG